MQDRQLTYKNTEFKAESSGKSFITKTKSGMSNHTLDTDLTSHNVPFTTHIIVLIDEYSCVSIYYQKRSIRLDARMPLCLTCT